MNIAQKETSDENIYNITGCSHEWHWIATEMKSKNHDTLRHNGTDSYLQTVYLLLGAWLYGDFMNTCVVQNEVHRPISLHHFCLHPQKPRIEDASCRPGARVAKIVHVRVGAEGGALPCTTETTRPFRLCQHQQLHALIPGSIAVQHDCNAVHALFHA